MSKTWNEVKVEVTVNGSGFDTPTDIHIEDKGEIPSCSMIFPGGTRSRYKILKRDLVRAYIGLDEVPDYPTFIGYQTDEDGIINTPMEFSGALYRAMKDKQRVLDTNNFDGQEVSNALYNIVKNVNGLSWLNLNVEKTSPVVQVPDQTRFKTGTSKYEIMRTFRDFSVNPLDPINIVGYAFFVHGDTFHFRKIPVPTDTEPSVTLAYGDNLLDFVPESSTRNTVNKVTVVGKGDVFAEFQNDHRIAIDGLLEDDPISDNEILSNGSAREVARSHVLGNMISDVPLVVNSHLLLETIPKSTVIELTGCPYGLSDKYLVQGKQISVSPGNFRVSCSVTTPVDIVSEYMSQLLGLNRDLPITSAPSGSQSVQAV